MMIVTSCGKFCVFRGGIKGYFVEAFLVEVGLLWAGALPGILRPVVDDESD
jgi:hypothetical protein